MVPNCAKAPLDLPVGLSGLLVLIQALTVHSLPKLAHHDILLTLSLLLTLWFILFIRNTLKPALSILKNVRSVKRKAYKETR